MYFQLHFFKRIWTHKEMFRIRFTYYVMHIVLSSVGIYCETIFIIVKTLRLWRWSYQENNQEISHKYNYVFEKKEERKLCLNWSFFRKFHRASGFTEKMVKIRSKLKRTTQVHFLKNHNNLKKCEKVQ